MKWKSVCSCKEDRNFEVYKGSQSDAALVGVAPMGGSQSLATICWAIGRFPGSALQHSSIRSQTSSQMLDNFCGRLPRTTCITTACSETSKNGNFSVNICSSIFLTRGQMNALCGTNLVTDTSKRIHVRRNAVSISIEDLGRLPSRGPSGMDAG
jgi:hypothetical protein